MHVTALASPGPGSTLALCSWNPSPEGKLQACGSLSSTPSGDPPKRVAAPLRPSLLLGCGDLFLFTCAGTGVGLYPGLSLVAVKLR